jgi:hypothetical protein
MRHADQDVIRFVVHHLHSKRTFLDVLRELEIDVPNPEKLSEKTLTTKLWQVIHGLLRHNVVLCNTDHLSDRDLYALLWKETLRREFTKGRHHTLHLDMTQTGVDNGMGTYLKYYASEAQRQMYLEVYPDYKMPKRVEPPLRRDHLIPDGPEQRTGKRLN